MNEEAIEALKKIHYFIKLNKSKNYMIALLDREVPNLKSVVKNLTKTMESKPIKNNLEIFDKDGKSVHAGLFVAMFILEEAKKHDMSNWGILIGIEEYDNKMHVEIMDLLNNVIGSIVVPNEFK